LRESGSGKENRGNKQRSKEVKIAKNGEWDVFAILKKVFQTRYVGMIEADLVRLRMENRALMNSLLGTAGFPPVEFAEPVKPVELPRMRRRSWQQIQKRNEMEAREEKELLK
jgi:hypothetical protein